MGIMKADDKAAKAVFLAFHAAAVAAAAFGPAKALAAALVVSLLALGRYLAMAQFATSIGLSPMLSFLYGSLWLAALAALAAALFVVGKSARPALPWAAAAALAGPLAASLIAAFRAGLVLVRGGREGAKESA